MLSYSLGQAETEDQDGWTREDWDRRPFTADSRRHVSAWQLPN